MLPHVTSCLMWHVASITRCLMWYVASMTCSLTDTLPQWHAASRDMLPHVTRCLTWHIASMTCCLNDTLPHMTCCLNDMLPGSRLFCFIPRGIPRLLCMQLMTVKTNLFLSLLGFACLELLLHLFDDTECSVEIGWRRRDLTGLLRVSAAKRSVLTMPNIIDWLPVLSAHKLHRINTKHHKCPITKKQQEENNQLTSTTHGENTHISLTKTASVFGNAAPSLRARVDPGWKKLSRRYV